MNRIVSRTIKCAKIVSRNVSTTSRNSCTNKSNIRQIYETSLTKGAIPDTKIPVVVYKRIGALAAAGLGYLGYKLWREGELEKIISWMKGPETATESIVDTDVAETETAVTEKAEAVTVVVPEVSYVPKHAQYLIIGAGTAAHSAYQEIKARDPKAKVWLIGKENHTPYPRPPLSKNFWFISAKQLEKSLDRNPPDGRSIYYESETYFFKPEDLEESENGGVSVICGVKVVKLDADAKKVYLENGSEISYDKCLIATGGQPRNLPIFKEAPKAVQDRVVLFRTIDDFQNLYKLSSSAKNIVVVGGGFLGSELAVSLQYRTKKQKTGATVTQVFPEKGNLGLVLPKQISQWLTSFVEAEGVKVLSERTIQSVGFKNNQVEITLSDDTQLQADQVVVAVGLEPSVDLAVSAGLEVDSKNGGFLVNQELEARSNVWVAGDAACFYDRKLGRRRVEHYDNAQHSGRVAGMNMTGGSLPYTYQSMFWSDIGDVALEAVGLADSNLETTVINVLPEKGEEQKEVETAEDVKSNKKVIFYRRGPDVVGILTVNLPRKCELARRFIDAGLKEANVMEAAKHFFVEEKESEQTPTETSSENSPSTDSSPAETSQ